MGTRKPKLSEVAMPGDAKTQVAILKFGAKWCGPCRAMQSAWEAFRAELPDDVAVLELDVDKPEAKPFDEQYEVLSVPTILFLEARHPALPLETITSSCGKVALVNALKRARIELADRVKARGRLKVTAAAMKAGLVKPVKPAV